MRSSHLPTLLVCLSLGLFQGVRMRYSTTPTFQRDSVESLPLHRQFSAVRSHLAQHVFGTRYLPLRAAVESVPKPAHLLRYSAPTQRVPLRDAVERRPYPDIGVNPFEPELSWAGSREYQHLRMLSPDLRSDRNTVDFVRESADDMMDLYGVDTRGQNSVDSVETKMQNYYGNKVYGFNPYKVVCYVEGWAVYRKAPMRFASPDVDPFACTHLIYAFAKMDPHSFKITPQDEEYDIVKGGYRSTLGLKRVNPALKVMISVGGWVEGSRKFSQMASSAYNRREFIRSVLHFLDQHGFDGLDLDWEYPGAEDLGGRRSDKEHFALLVEELSEVFAPRGWLLSAAVSPSRFRLEDAYDVPRLGRNLDFINLMAFDLHAERDSAADHHAPLAQRKYDQGLNVFYSVDYAVRYWLRRGAPKEKLIVGVPFYGRSFSLANATVSSPPAPVKGLGTEGRYTQEKGFLAYFEILELLESGTWQRRIDDAGSPYIVGDDQWVGYDDTTSMAAKMAYIKKGQLGGAMVWAMDLDDFQGLYGDKWPLLGVVKNALLVSGNELNVVQPVMVSPPTEGIPMVVLGDDQQSNCSGQGYARDPVNCAVYYRCQWGVKHTYVCPDGLHYDKNLRLCNWPNKSQCVDDRRAPLDIGDGWTSVDSKPMTYRHERPDRPKLIGEDSYRVVCYFTNWAWYRKGEAKFVPEHVDPRLCTHIVYAYAALDPNDLSVKPFDPWADIDNNFYQRLTAGPRQQNGDVTVMLALGGWTDSSGDKYSRLVSDGAARRRFAANVVAYLRRHNFKGLHLDWNYPKCWQSDCKKGPASDRDNFSKLVQELKETFDRNDPPLALAVAISGYKEVIDEAYDLAEIGKYVEFMSVMTYDYHGGWEKRLGHISPLYYRQGDQFPQYNTNFTLEYLVSRGAPRKKLLVGIPFYGQSFTMSSPAATEIGSASKGAGKPGELTRQPGMLAYYEICDRLLKQGWKINRDPNGATGPSAFHGDQWVGFEDVESVKQKAQYIRNMGFGGAMAWTVDLDDFSNRCCREPFPLLRTINRVLGNLLEGEPVAGDCTKPAPPVTPTPPELTTGVDSGASMTTTPAHEHHQETTTSQPSWTQPTTRPTTTTTTRPSTPWWQPTTSPTTSSPPWWQDTTTTTTSTTTPRPPPPPITTTMTTTTTVAPPPLPPQQLPPVGACEPGRYLPDPSNCNAYYRCILGELQKEYCATGLHWNKALGACDWPSEAKCGQQQPIVQEPGTTTTATRPPNDWQTPPTTQRPWWEATTSGEQQTWWSQEQTSQQTWWPQQTTTTTQATPQQVWWTPEATTYSPPQPPQRPEALPAPAPPQQSEAVCVSGSYFGVPGQCNGFFICVNGNRMRQNCASGLVWNQDNKICDWPYNVKCDDAAGYSSSGLYWPYHTPGFRVGVDSPCDQGAYTSYPGNCNKYLFCLWGKYMEFACSPGLHWNNKQNTCDWPSNANCQAALGDPINEVVTPQAPTEGTSLPTNRPTPPPTQWTQPPTKPPTQWTQPPTPPPTQWTQPPTKPPPQWSPPTQSPTQWPNQPTAAPTRPPTTAVDHGESKSDYFKVVCYFTNWAWYRQGAGKYLPEDIDENLCTHIIYGFAVLDYENLIVKAHDSWADFDNKFYERVIAYKKKGIKVSLALGGWNDSQGDKYSRLVNSPSARRRFVNHVLEFLAKYDFDGLDLDWEYPKCWQVDCSKGPESDKESFAALLRELRQAFNPRGLLLSAAVSPSKTVVDAGYDVKTLGETLDWVAVMTYDYHGQWDKKTGHVAPMYFHPDDDFYFFNANYSINYWISEGVPRRKIVMGMPLYGQSFQLAQASTNGLNSRAPGPGQAGEFTRAAGFLAYYEICDRIKNRGWTVVKDAENRMGPYAFQGNQWVSFDDVDMIRLKSEYIRRMDLGGGMIWALDLDDFKNTCGDGPHPLLSTIRRVLAPPPSQSDQVIAGGGQRPVDSPQVPPLQPVRPVEPVEPVETAPQPPPQPPPMVVDLSTTPQVEVGVSTPRPVTPVVIGGGSSDFKVVCYFTNWAWYRQGGGKYLPSDIDPDLCTHVVYGFAVLNGDQLIIKPHDSWADFDNKFYEKVTALKAKGIKVLIAIGGWNDSAGDKYSRLANSPAARTRFISHVTDFIATNNFDGLDLDWEYPKCWQVDCKKGPDSDKQAFAALVRELRAAFSPRGYLLSAAVSPSKAVVDAGYDVPSLAADLDWIAVMCYDYHGQWDKITGHVAPMYPHPEDNDVTFNSNFSINYWISRGAPPSKLVMGMPMYGQSFSLADNNNRGLNAPTYGGGEAGEATRARGFLSYYEICERIQNRGWKVVKDPEGSIGPYAHLGDQWVSFDDTAMIRYKSNYVRRMGLGGGMIWALDLDDFKNKCGCETYPLLKTINRVLRGYPGPGPNCDISGEAPKTELVEPVKTPEWGPVSPIASPPDAVKQESDVSCGGGQIYLAHPDCDKYYMCQYGQPLTQLCPAGLHWNKDHCDWPENAKCAGGQGPPPTTSPATTTTQVVTTYRPVVTPTPAVPGTIADTIPDTGYKVVCYFTNWAWYRQGIGKYVPDDVDSSLCTHIAYGFAVLDGSTLLIKPHDSWADLDNKFYAKVTDFKRRGLKVVLAIGGWNDSLGDKYSRLANDPGARARFVKHVMEFIREHNFDGLDLDWEYPKCWQVDCNKGPASDKEGFAALVRELSVAFKPSGLLLSSAVSPSKVVIDLGYDVPALSKYFDWISVMTYDFHGHWDKQTGHVAPLYYVPGDTYDYFNANFSINYWLEKGADPKKIIMGMPMYGQSFSLADGDEKGLNAKTYGPGEAGEFTRAGGFLAYYEICDNVKTKGWTPVRDPEGRIGPYAVKGNQWASYDDVSDIRKKCQFIKQMGLGGGMIWALDLDDFRNRCGCGKHPLLKTINRELRGIASDTRDCT